jgi:hypothetical protein
LGNALAAHLGQREDPGLLAHLLGTRTVRFSHASLFSLRPSDFSGNCWPVDGVQRKIAGRTEMPENASNSVNGF